MVRALWLQGRREGRYCFGSRVRREFKLRARLTMVMLLFSARKYILCSLAGRESLWYEYMKMADGAGVTLILLRDSHGSYDLKLVGNSILA